MKDKPEICCTQLLTKPYGKRSVNKPLCEKFALILRTIREEVIQAVVTHFVDLQPLLVLGGVLSELS